METKRSSGEALSDAAKKYIEIHSCDKFSLDEMAKSLFVNGSYLLRTFKRNTGMTPLYYHHLIRCENAKKLLLQTELSVSQVGETVGFVSSSHFSHIFRKMGGCTPSEFRRLHSHDEAIPSEPRP